MKKIKTGLLLAFACVSVAFQANPKGETPELASSNDPNEKLVQWIHHKVDSVVQANNIPALSFGIIQDGNILITKGLGVLNRETKQAATENTLYQIASDTKKMTGVIAKNLVNEKVVELDKPIVHYLEGLLDTKAKERLKTITLRHLLLHTSGLPYREPTMTRKDGEPMLVPYAEEILLNDLNKVEPEFAPETKFSYSNFGYAVAGYVCEVASKRAYTELILQYISEAYHMPNTAIVLTDKQKGHLATPYLKEDRFKETSAFNMGKLSAAGGAYSTVNDLSKLMMHQIATYTKVDDQTDPLMLHANPYEKVNGYGFGLGKKVFETGIQYGHGGDMDGFASAYVFSPEYRSGVIILTSSGGKWVGELEKELFAKLTNQTYIPPKQSLALAFYNLLSDKSFEKSKNWLKENKGSEKYYLQEEEMNNVGYALLKQNKEEQALKVFQYNVELFPNSANVYDSLGECYLAVGNKKLSLENYRKSLQLNPENRNAKVQIEKIEKNNKN